MYLAGEPVTEIARVTGSGAIYSVLRQEGHEPSRFGRLRDPVVRADREQQLLACLKLAAADLDVEVLGIRDYRAWRETSTAHAPAETAAARLFGTWAKAVDAAGLRTFTARSERDQWDQTAVIGWLRDAAGTSGELSRAGYEQWRLTRDSTAASAAQIHRRFGWSHMIAEAGLARPTVKPAFSRDDMIGALRSAGDGHYISMVRYLEWRSAQSERHPSVGPIVARFGGWGRACTAARLQRPDRLSDKKLLVYIKQASKHFGKHPTMKQYQQWSRRAADRPGIHIVTKRYSFATKTLKTQTP